MSLRGHPKNKNLPVSLYNSHVTLRVHFTGANKNKDVFSTLQTSLYDICFVFLPPFLSSSLPSFLLPFLLSLSFFRTYSQLKSCFVLSEMMIFLKKTEYQDPQESLNEWYLKQYFVRIIACCKRFQVKSENIYAQGCSVMDETLRMPFFIITWLISLSK